MATSECTLALAFILTHREGGAQLLLQHAGGFPQNSRAGDFRGAFSAPIPARDGPDPAPVPVSIRGVAKRPIGCYTAFIPVLHMESESGFAGGLLLPCILKNGCRKAGKTEGRNEQPARAVDEKREAGRRCKSSYWVPAVVSARPGHAAAAGSVPRRGKRGSPMRGRGAVCLLGAQIY